MKLLYGDSAARKVSERVHEQVADLSTLKQTPSNRRVTGQHAFVRDSQTLWQWNENSTLTGDDVLVVTPSDAPSSGRWLRAIGPALLSLPIYATTPDATILLTVPTGCMIKLHEFAWQVSRTFTGAAGRALGVSSSNHPGHTGAGNFLGGATGNMATVLDASIAGDFQMGSIASGTFDSHINKREWMGPGHTIRLDALGGGNFGTGAGAVLVACDVLKNAGG